MCFATVTVTEGKFAERSSCPRESLDRGRLTAARGEDPRAAQSTGTLRALRLAGTRCRRVWPTGSHVGPFQCRGASIERGIEGPDITGAGCAAHPPRRDWARPRRPGWCGRLGPLPGTVIRIGVPAESALQRASLKIMITAPWQVAPGAERSLHRPACIRLTRQARHSHRQVPTGIAQVPSRAWPPPPLVSSRVASSATSDPRPRLRLRQAGNAREARTAAGRLGAPRALPAVALGCRTGARRAGVHTAASARSPSGAGCRTTRPQRSAEATGHQPGVSTRGAIPMGGRRTVRPLVEPLSVASASAAPLTGGCPLGPSPAEAGLAADAPTPAARAAAVLAAHRHRRSAPASAGSGRGVAHDARTACPVEAEAAASPEADERAGSYGDELEQRVRVVRLVPAPSSDARSLGRAGDGCGGRPPRPARPHSHACACARCSAGALRPVHARTTPAETEKRFGQDAPCRCSGAQPRTPRSCASAARRVSGAPRRDELVRCDVRVRERGGRRPNGDNGELTATEYSRVGKRVARTREH